ncbi:DEAD-like helicase [Heliothis virescens ascovirus 3j]|uniref:DEAD-like helicase n=1 Tax=Heliothis virescens ascovirus 3j TaxID=1561067 RepID=A0A2Z5V8L5_9VIRU|nr:DEAD-like helicase [Heliothis virescens ascovirus 3j]
MLKYALPLYPIAESTDESWSYEHLDKLTTYAEFNETQLLYSDDDDRDRKNETRRPMPHQILVANYTTPRSPIDGIIVIHGVGTGKTLTAILAMINNITAGHDQGMKRGLVLTPNRAVMNSFRNELNCYYRSRFSDRHLNDFEIDRYLSKTFFFNTITAFANTVSRTSDVVLHKEWNATFVVIDEAHDLSVHGVDYPKINGFLKLLTSRKVLLLTATPMRNNLSDLVPLHNLLMKLSTHDITVEQFNRDLVTRENCAEYVCARESPTEYFLRKFAGLVSYLPSIVDVNEVDIVNVGERGLYGLRNTVIVVHDMSDVMSATYHYAGAGERSDRDVALLRQRQICRFVFPDGTYGAEGYATWMDNKTGRPTRKFLDRLRGGTGTSREDILKNVAKYSPRYAWIAKSVINAAERGEKSMVYDDLVTGSGLLVFAAVLEALGLERGYGRGARSFLCLTREVMTVPSIVSALKIFNDRKNVKGANVAIILGSRVIAEGITLKDVIHEHVVAHWNDAETEQIIGRGIRYQSHAYTIADWGSDAKPNVFVYRHATTDSRKKNIKTVDILMYATSEAKRKNIDGALRALSSVALTCRDSNNTFVKSVYRGRYTGRNITNDNTIPLDAPRVTKSFIAQLDRLFDYRNQNVVVKVDSLLKMFNIDPNSTYSLELLFVIMNTIQKHGQLDVDKYIDCNGQYISISKCVDEFRQRPTFVYPFVLDNVSLYGLDAYRDTLAKDIISPLILLDSERHTEGLYPMTRLPVIVIQGLLELAISSQGTKDPYDTLNKMIQYYGTSTNGDNDIRAAVWLATTTGDDSGYRILTKHSGSWVSCPSSMVPFVQAMKSSIESQLNNDMLAKNLKYYGVIHPSTDDFCIKTVSQNTPTNRRCVMTGRKCVTWSGEKLKELARDIGIDTGDPSSVQNRKAICYNIRSKLEELGAVITDVTCGVQAKRK